ncbi:MAG TPA: hemerythrin domain-containing protein [Hanamia sp.]|nr:hemerythrin domain-containing protein [Hanamia sp.]
MEKNPIKRNPNIVKLSRDHHASLIFCWKLRQGIKRHAAIDRMVKYAQYFWLQHFAPHFREEEELLFAPLADEKVQKAIEDHKRIHSLINELAHLDSKESAEQLSGLADAIDEHVRYEERILFPHLEVSLSDEQLELIGNQISDKPLQDNYEDTFWEKSASL